MKYQKLTEISSLAHTKIEKEENSTSNELNEALKEFEKQIPTEKRLFNETLCLNLSRKYLAVGPSNARDFMVVIKIQSYNKGKNISFTPQDWKQLIHELSERINSSEVKAEKYVLTARDVTLKLRSSQVDKILEIKHLVNIHIDRFEKLYFKNVYKNVLLKLNPNMLTIEDKINFISNSLGLDDACKAIFLGNL